MVTWIGGIGVKLFPGDDELYNCAVINTVVPTRFNGTVVLKKAEIDVMVPLRGDENAKFTFPPLLRSIVAPEELIPEILFPNPTTAIVPGPPPATVVIVIGLAEA